MDVRVTKYNVSNETSFLLLPFTYSFIRSSIDYDNKWIFSRFPHENSLPTLWSCSVALLNILIYDDVTSLRLCIYYCSFPMCGGVGKKTKRKCDRHVSSSIYLPTFMLLSIFFLA